LAVSRRHALSPPDAEDFCSWVVVRLIENDYAVFKKFEGRSKLSTYLTTVVGRLFLDYRNHLWGKWRPSAMAKRLGPTAIRLEELLYRDHHSFTDALAMIQERGEEYVSEEDLEGIFVKLKTRHKRRFVSDVALRSHASADLAESITLAREMTPASLAVSSAVGTALENLDSQDALVLRLRFEEGMRVVDIASLLALDQQDLYARIKRLLRLLKRSILSLGVTEDQVRDLLDWDSSAWDLDFHHHEESGNEEAARGEAQ